MIEKIAQRAMTSQQLQQPDSHSMYVKKFMSDTRSSPQRTFCFQPLGIAKPVETVKRIENTQLSTGMMQAKDTGKSHGDYKNDNTSVQLSTLHVKLYKEAERIRKWKITTEMDIEEKEQKLRESMQLMESQRKSLLELQLENENLSLRLSEEIENKQEIMQKISATRELCYAARGHMDNLEKRICSCEETRIIIDDVNAKRMKEVEVLLHKFEELSNQHEEKINLLNNAVKIEKAEKETLKANYTTQLNCSAEELKKLHEAFKIKELHNSQLQQERDNCNANISALLQKQDELHEQLRENQLVYSEKEKAVFLLQQQITELQDDKCKLHASLEKSEVVVKELELVKLKLSEELAALKLRSVDTSEEFCNKLSALECLFENETIRTKELESILNEKEREIKALKEKHDDVAEKLNESNHQCEDMQKLMEELGERKLYLEESILKQQEALQQLQLANEELTAKGLLLEDAQKCILQKEEEIVDLKKEHDIKLTSLDDTLKEKQSEINRLQFLNTTIEEELKSNMNKIEDLEKQVRASNKKFKMITKVNTQSKGKLQATLETTVKENEILTAKTVSLQEELEKTRSEWKTEKENMKNTHKFEMKEILDLLDKTEENYQNMASTKEDEIKELKNEIAKVSNELKTEQKKLDKTEKEWEKERSSMKELHSSQMKDVFDILKKAEESYQKTILAKEGEIEELRKEIVHNNNCLKDEEDKETEIKRLQYEKDNLQDMIETVKKTNEVEITKLKSENVKLQIELETLQKNKEKEIARLQPESREETRKMTFDNLLQDTNSANITHCTVKRSSQITAEVQPKLQQDYKSYSRNSSYMSYPEKGGVKRSLMPITEVKPLQEKHPLDPKPKQRKFFKSSRAIKRGFTEKGLLWFDIEEE